MLTESIMVKEQFATRRMQNKPQRLYLEKGGYGNGKHKANIVVL
jgi:hypothetical protein